VVEDLHWAEPLLFDLIDYLADRSRDIPLLLICVARPELVERRQDWGGGRLNATTITVDALPAGEIESLIANLLGGEAPPAGVAERITRAAEGNPLFAEQMVAMLIDDGLLVRGDGGWAAAADLERISVPESIQALLSARVDNLPEPERETTRSASIVGRVFYQGAVESLTAPSARAGVDEELVALTRKQLIRPQGSTFDADDTYGFVHILLRDAAYDSLPKRTRASLHEQFADWLDGRASKRPGEYDEIVGYHLEAAHRYRTELGRLTEHDRAAARRGAEKLGSAGRHALARGDVAAAANLLSRAIGLLEADDRGRVEYGFDLFEALLDQGELEQATASLAETDAAIAARPDARLGARALILRCFLESHTGSLSIDGLDARIDDSLRTFEAGDDARGEASARVLLADLRMDAGRFGSAAEELERGLAAARQAADPREESRILSWLASALFWGPTPAREGIERCERIIDEATESPLVQAKTRLILAGMHGMAGDTDLARELFAEGSEAIEELGLLVSLATGRQISGMVELLAGEPDAAERELRAGFDSLREMGQLGFAVGGAVFLARALIELDRPDEVERLAAFVERSAPADDDVAQAHRELLLARVAAIRGEAGGSVQPCREAAEALDRTDDLRTRGDARVDLAAVLSSAGDDNASRAELEEAARLYELKGVAPSLARVRATLAA
jgi:tetratricopeptide (TPR) repeat protein